jgi:Phosphotransferase enzyme family
VPHALRPLRPRELADSVDALVEGASERTPMHSVDSKSGARFEAVVIAGERFVLKHVDRAEDWIARQTGDVACWPVVVWEAGLVDLAPEPIEHAIVGAARTPTGGAVLMRDVGAWLVPPDDRPIRREQHLRFLDHLAAFHAATWGWDEMELCPLVNRYSLFGPHALDTEAALGYPEPVPKLAAEGWERLHLVAPAMAARLAPLRAEPWVLVDALAGTPRAFLHGDWKLGNLGTTPAGRTVLVDWSVPGSGPPLAELAHYLALNVARFPAGHTKDDAVAAYRSSLERYHIDTAPWWDRQLALCLLGIMLDLGWNKACDDAGDELAWWAARVDEGVALLG